MISHAAGTVNTPQAGLRLRRGSILALALCLCLPHIARAGSLLSETRDIMGTYVQIKVEEDSRTPARDAMEAAFLRVSQIDHLMSTYKKDSELSRLNRSAYGGWVAVSPDMWLVLNMSREISVETGGAFDVTVRPLVLLWKEAGRVGKLPADERLRGVMSQVGYKKLEFDPAGKRVRFRAKGMALDLGAIAKGYAVDAAAKTLKDFGCRNFIVNAGGDVRTGGTRPGGDAWHIGIQDPREPAPVGGLLKSYLRISDAAVATSGNYQQFTVIAGERHSHIIDPRDGRPADAVPSVTVIAPDCTTADALATALSVLGVEDGLRFIEKNPGLETLMITVEGEKLKFHMSSGFGKFLSGPLASER